MGISIGCKVHAAIESLPLSIAIGPGDDSKRFIEVLGRIRVKRKIERPINRPKELYASLRLKEDKRIPKMHKS